MQPSINNKSALTKAIVTALIIAGTLDMLSAIIIYDVVMHRVTTMQILDGIAATLFGKTISNQTVMAVIGLLLHYFITFCFVIFYFLIYPRIKPLQKNIIVSGLLYGMFVWCIMNLIVVPLANGNHYHFLSFPAFLRQILPLMFCIGLPISFIASNYYTRKTS